MTDLFSVAGKTALVTGGSRGIGRMIAGGFVEAGARVYISSRNAETCRTVAEELSGVGVCLAVPADLSTESGCRALADAMTGREDRLDVLVNNAGNTWGAPLEEFGEAAWDRVLSLNVKGVFHTTKFLLPLLEAAARDDDPARVVNIGSIDGIHVPVLETYSYSASKAAVHQLTRHLARKLAPRITVNAIAPGPFESKMMAATLDAFGGPDRRRRADEADRPARRHGRRRHLSGLAGRRLSHRRHPPRRRRHRHRRMTPDRRTTHCRTTTGTERRPPCG